MNNLLGQFEWRGPQEGTAMLNRADVLLHKLAAENQAKQLAPSQQEIIKDLHQQVLSKQLEIESLRAELQQYKQDAERYKLEGFNEGIEAAENRCVEMLEREISEWLVYEIRALKREVK